MKPVFFLVLILLVAACQDKKEEQAETSHKVVVAPIDNTPSLVVLGTIQDAGSPHIGCKKECCKDLFEHPDPLRKVVSLGIVDPENDKTYLFEATPDISTQVKKLGNFTNGNSELPDGIFLTHAHIGHYTGLMYLGKEAANSNNIPVYTMPRMKTFLETNGPWSQLVEQHNISIKVMAAQMGVKLTSNLEVVPMLVPHRDEFSETVGYKIKGPNKTALFIPDIDKWSKWETDISEFLSEVDYAFLDATFFDGDEINSRDISEIPHPFIIESMEEFRTLNSEEKKKIYFIHFNHTNAVINPDSRAYQQVIDNGFNVARIHQILPL